MTEKKTTTKTSLKRPKVGQKPAKKPVAKGSAMPAHAGSAGKTSTKKATLESPDTFAVIKTGGKQYKIQVGEYFRIEKLKDGMKAGDKIKFDKVLLEISDSNHYCEQLVHALMYSKNTKTWMETYSEFSKEFEAYRLLNHRLSYLLTTNKMKDPPDD